MGKAYYEGTKPTIYQKCQTKEKKKQTNGAKGQLIHISCHMKDQQKAINIGGDICKCKSKSYCECS